MNFFAEKFIYRNGEAKIHLIIENDVNAFTVRLTVQEAERLKRVIETALESEGYSIEKS